MKAGLEEACPGHGDGERWNCYCWLGGNIIEKNGIIVTLG